MEPVMARKMWRTLEPYHGMIYFAPEATAAYEALGVMGFDGYFASRAAPMGAVPAEVVVATFFNFNPAVVHHAIPAGVGGRPPRRRCSRRASTPPAQALRRAAGDLLDDPSVAARGRAGPHRRRRLHRRRSSALRGPRRAAVARRSGARALARHHAAARVPRRRAHRVPGRGRASTASTRSCSTPRPARCPAPALQGSRQWDDAAWEASVAQPRATGASSTPTAPSPRPVPPCASRSRTAPTPWPWRRGRRLGEEGCDELRSLVRPLSQAIVGERHLRAPSLTTEV